MNEKKIAVADVVFRADLYPRIEQSAATVQQYKECLDVLPPIEVNQRNELIDGWHRWTAHRSAEAPSIAVTVTETRSDAHLLELAIERNASHGLQLSQADKQSMARRIYHETPEKERKTKKADLARVLSVPERTVQSWLSRIDKDAKEARNSRIFDLWLSCHTQEEIAERENLTQQAVAKLSDGFTTFGSLAESCKPAALHQVDFEVPLYNVWKQQTKSGDLKHFGNSEATFVDRLLYLYTEPFDVVVDPFAGSGSTIDVCKKRLRRYWASDRKPIVEREKDIRKHDVTSGLPALPRWEGVKLVYLDPPYWKQAEGEYSKDADDLANMELPRFTDTLAGVVNGFAKKLHAGARIALIIQPTQWRAPERQFTDHVADVLRLVKLPIDQRIQAPYESQQCSAQMVEWAKANRQCLVLSREIVVWRVA
jgi:hypothetical protein